MMQTTVRRRARIEAFIEVDDLNGTPHLLPITHCEVEEHHSHVSLRLGSDSKRVVRISHRQFNALIATRQAVYQSW